MLVPALNKVPLVRNRDVQTAGKRALQHCMLYVPVVMQYMTMIVALLKEQMLLDRQNLAEMCCFKPPFCFLLKRMEGSTVNAHQGKMSQYPTSYQDILLL